MPEKQIEIELKLRIDPKHVARLKRAAVLREVREGRRMIRTHLVSIYHDTSKLSLSRKGLAIRVRKKGTKGWEQTVKVSNGLREALPERPEWTVPMENGKLDLALFQEPDVVALLDRLVGKKQIGRIFETDLHRTSVDLTYRDAVMELAIDQGVVRAGEREAPLSEVELELKEGHPAALFDLALELQRTVPLYLSLRSKASRGRALYFNEQPGFYKAEAVGLHAGMSAEAAFRAVLSQGLSMILGNEVCVRDDIHIEGCHQMRIGLRRLRVAFGLFRKNLPQGEAVLIRRLLKQCSKGLDSLRDWDVFLTETLPTVEARFADHPGLPEIRAEAQKQRAIALATAHAMLESPEYQQVLLLLGAWATYSRWASGAQASQMQAMAGPVGDLADPLLEQSCKRVAKRGDKVAALSVVALHAWRLDIKQLRYACDFFFEIHGGKAVRKFRAGLAGLQEILGQMNDATVAEQRLQALVPQLGRDGLMAVGLITGWYAARADHRLAGLQDAWQKFDKQKPFWK
ncbi:CYTH and CHAD domain-containing protein [Thalassospira sp.]|uniref:CYTH and CHAD domain-containing protein n=1 Tax=Thalassospira sp. TaxID=1912094 RepID=UPI0027328146|nr:CYTH and CHAD domain-containing protein [Thalassospira sp.]MDP2696787.1 CYTH and CHAD domain-containing protein [Thalassospira sp.]